MRIFIEDTLLTTTGYRDNSALDDALSCPDVMLSILNELVNRRLLAYEDRHHTRRVELRHDVLYLSSRSAETIALPAKRSHGLSSRSSRPTKRREWHAGN